MSLGRSISSVDFNWGMATPLWPCTHIPNTMQCTFCTHLGCGRWLEAHGGWGTRRWNVPVRIKAECHGGMIVNLIGYQTLQCCPTLNSIFALRQVVEVWGMAKDAGRIVLGARVPKACDPPTCQSVAPCRARRWFFKTVLERHLVTEWTPIVATFC